MVCSHPLYPGAEVLALDLPCLVVASEAAVPLAALQGGAPVLPPGPGGLDAKRERAVVASFLEQNIALSDQNPEQNSRLSIFWRSDGIM